MILLQMTGLSGAGKTTISSHVKENLQHLGYKVELLDGGIFRKNAVQRFRILQRRPL